MGEHIGADIRNAFRGLPVEYHLRLGVRLASGIAMWVPEEHIEDVLDVIRYHSKHVKDIYHEDGKP